ncbi:MAG: FAD-dependent oxidoreductase, partial [Pseudomonadota bacterium]
MKGRYDVVIVGGAAIGASIAYHLTADPDFDGSVLVAERDPTYARASTALSAASIRTQFSNPINVKISQYGGEVIRNFGELMAVGEDRPDLSFQPGGYLFLADTPEMAQILRENHAAQRSCGADVVLWERDELAAAFPHLRVGDVELASYGRSGEGWFDNTGLLQGFRAKARAQGATFVADEVVAMRREGGRVASVTLKSGAD